jgi:peptidoglycan/xylan/chitin deacetylase (PgdA/CDA1 family)
VTRNAALLWFALAAVLVLAVGAVIAGVLAATLSVWMGLGVLALAVAIVAVAAWSCFSPNTSNFGPVITGRGVQARMMALTFDDGPSEDVTPRVLDALAERGARATFFVLGRHVDAHPEVASRILNEGHELASHGYDHSILTFTGTAGVQEQLRRTEEALARIEVDPLPRLFRAPHGFRNPFVSRAAQRAGYRIVGWTKGVWDTAAPGVETIVRRSVEGFRPGAVLLLHDADGSGAGGDRSQTAEAVPPIVDAAAEQGYELVTVSELAARAPSRRMSRIRLAVAAAVVVVLVELARRKLNLGVINTVDIGWWWVLAAVAANFVSIMFKAVVWRATIDAVPEIPEVGYADVIPALFVGFLLNTVLFARLGEIARIGVLRRRLRQRGVDVKIATVAGTAVSEQIVLGVALVMVVLAMAFVLSVPSWARNAAIALAVALVVIALGLVGLEVYSRYRRRRRRGDRDLAVAWWQAALRQGEQLLYAVVQGQRILRDPKKGSIAVSAGVASWVAQIVGILWAMNAFGIHLGLGAAGIVFLTSTLVQLFTLVPLNVGVFQGAIYLPLTTTYNVDGARALAFGIGLQLIEAVLGVGVGFYFLSREGLSLAEARTFSDVEDEPSEPLPSPSEAGEPVGRRP